MTKYDAKTTKLNVITLLLRFKFGVNYIKRGRFCYMFDYFGVIYIDPRN